MERPHGDERDARDDQDALRAEIDATRTRLSETAEALAFKSDVPARARDALNDRAEALGTTLGSAAVHTANVVQSFLEREGDDTRDPGTTIAHSVRVATTTARRRPLAFAIATFAAGFVLGRLWPRHPAPGFSE